VDHQESDVLQQGKDIAMSRTPAVKENGLQTSERAAEPRLLPAVDVYETPTELVAQLDMPGLSKDGIDVEYKDRVLTVKGRVKSSEVRGHTNLWREFHEGEYIRTFNVREDLDVGRVAADYEDGVLTVRLPKQEAALARKIAVDVK
jgi:HSP20 family protein